VRTISHAAIGMSLAITMGSNVVMASKAEAAPGPGVCFEAITSSIDEGGLGDVPWTPSPRLSTSARLLP
jgi:hypothetical protein